MRLLLPSVLLLCAIGAIAWQTPPQQTSPPPRNGAKQQQGSQEESQCILKTAFAPETWANWALFFAAVGAGIIALKTLKAIQRESDEIKGIAVAAGDNAKVAKDGADAAKKNAAAATQNAQAVIDSERAWVVAETPKISEIASGRPVRIFWAIKNGGKTPARVIEKAETSPFIPTLKPWPH